MSKLSSLAALQCNRRKYKDWEIGQFLQDYQIRNNASNKFMAEAFGCSTRTYMRIKQGASLDLRRVDDGLWKLGYKLAVVKN